VEKTHQWLFLEPTATNYPIGRDISAQEPPHPAILCLMDSQALPVWAAEQGTARELSEVIQAFQALKFAEQEINRFLNQEPQTEDEIKSILKSISQGQIRAPKELQTAANILTKECTKATSLPLVLLASLKTKAAASKHLLEQYYDKAEELKKMQKNQGIINNNPDSGTNR
jgi:hypothetical protein